jgi:histidinol-phosphate aminotransferase
MEKKLVRIAGALLDIAARQSRDAAGSSYTTPYPAASQGVLNAVSGYLKGTGEEADSIRRELAGRLSQYTALPSGHIRFFDSLKRAVELIGRTYLEQGTEIVINSPCRGEIETLALCAGARVTQVDHDNPLDPQIEAVINHIGSRSRMIFIENPNRTTGAIFSESEIVFLLAYAEGTMVVIDESNFEYWGRSIADLVNRFPNLVVLRTVSGEYGMGPLGMCYIISDPDNLAFIDRVTVESPVSELVFSAAKAAFDDTSILRDRVESTAQARDYLEKNLPEMGYEFKIAPADFVIIRTADAVQATKILGEQGAIVEDLSHIGSLQGHIKVSVNDKDQAERLLVILGRFSGQLATGFNRNLSAATVDRLTTVKKAAVKVG